MVMTLQKRSSSIKRRKAGVGFLEGDARLKNGLNDLETARKHYSAMRDLIIRYRGGSRDERTLSKLWDLSRKAAAAIDDSKCKSLLLRADGYGADLFSESGHLKWARTEMSGAYFLRLQILRELDAFHARLLELQLEATRHAVAGLADSLRAGRRSAG